MDRQKQIAMRFMLYTYFKLDADAVEDTIVQKALDRAYSDATNEGAYNTRLYDDMAAPTIEEKKNRKDASDKVKAQAAEHIRSFLKILSSIESEEYFDEKHDELCRKLEETYETALGIRKFTYGNAQKWVNMTLKHLYLLGGAFCVCGRALDFQTGIDHCKAWLHVPVDSYIMEALYRDVELPRREGSRPLKRIKELTYNTIQGDLIPWSKWNQAQYIGVYRDIRKYGQSQGGDKCALVWENTAWMEVAKQRKQKQRNGIL